MLPGWGDKDLTGWLRALSAGPRTAPHVPAALAAALPPPPAAAAAPAPAPRPAPPPLRDEGDSGVTPAPQTPAHPRRALPPSKGAQLGGTPGRAPWGWRGTRVPSLGVARGLPWPEGARSPRSAALPRASSDRSRRRATTSSRSAVALASSLAWGEGTGRRGDRGGQRPPVSSSPAGALPLLATTPCPQAMLLVASRPAIVFLEGVGTWIWGKSLFPGGMAHPGEDSGAQGGSQEPQATQAPRGWHPWCLGGDRVPPSLVLERLHSPALGSRSIFPASPGHCSAG